jgi:hypothetical protein
MDSYDVLVIILAVALAIFLVLGIAVMILMINLLQKFKKVAESAEKMASNLESFSNTVFSKSGPIGIVRNIISLISGNTR